MLLVICRAWLSVLVTLSLRLITIVLKWGTVAGTTWTWTNTCDLTSTNEGKLIIYVKKTTKGLNFLRCTKVVYTTQL